jgi:hypothetical protein
LVLLISHQSANNGFEVSLREALYVDQNFPDADTITLPGGIFTLTLTSGNADGKWGDLNVSEDTTIIGESHLGNPSTIKQCVAVHQEGSGIVSISDVTFSTNSSVSDGALTLTRLPVFLIRHFLPMKRFLTVQR